MSNINSLNILIQKYNDFYKKNNFNINPTVWNPNTSYIMNTFTPYFRGENAYVWQECQGDNRETYAKYYEKIKAIDVLDKLLDKTKEDGSYGCISYNIDNVIVSRDLLDSILEIYFLKSCFSNLNELKILDIGAGYGRLCKRYTDCFPGSQYFVTDAIPYSTYCSNLYLGNNNNNVINLFDIEEKLKTIKIDMAINIHSFPECNINDVEWWIKLINSNKIKYIFFVPNSPDSTPDYILTNDKSSSILDIFTKYNYKVKHFRNLYTELNIEYSYVAPFFILENENF